MTLESRLTAFAQAVGGDIKELQEEDETVIVKAKVTGNLAIGSAYSSTPISFGTEVKDDENFWNGTRFQPTKAGWYRIHATSYCGGIPVGGYWTTYLVKNWPTGTPYNGTGTIESLSGGNSVVAGGYVFGENDAIVYFNGTTDYIELFYWTSHSGYTLYGAYSFFEVFSADHKGPKGDKGDKGDPGDSVQVPLDAWHLVGGGGEPAFQNSWVNFDGSAATPSPVAGARNTSFRKYPDGKVRLRGVVKNGAIGTVFTLPAGYRPSKDNVNFIAQGGGGFAIITVESDGDVRIVAYFSSGTNAYVFFDAVEFDTETVTEFAVGPKGDKGNPGSFIDAMTYLPSYDINEAVSGWGDANTVGKPDTDPLQIYLFTSIATDDQGQSPEGVTYVQTLVGAYEVEKVWRRFIVGSYISSWKLLSSPSSVWTSLSGLYFNSWTEYDTARYRRDTDGYVQLRGEIRAWTGGSTAADVGIIALPVGFRPLLRSGFPVWINTGGALSLYVQADGVIRVSTAVPAGAVVNISSIRFPTR